MSSWSVRRRNARVGCIDADAEVLVVRLHCAAGGSALEARLLFAFTPSAAWPSRSFVHDSGEKGMQCPRCTAEMDWTAIGVMENGYLCRECGLAGNEQQLTAWIANHDIPMGDVEQCDDGRFRVNLRRRQTSR